jgi:hypothetical protein
MRPRQNRVTLRNGLQPLVRPSQVFAVRLAQYPLRRSKNQTILLLVSVTFRMNSAEFQDQLFPRRKP